MGSSQDTEITLGTGKLLGIFFLMVAICAAFFTMGYLFGRSSTTMAASTTVVGTVPGAGSNPASKPSAGANRAADAPQPAADSSTTSQAPSTSQPTLLPVKATEESSSAPSAETRTAASGSYMVQVAAVSRQEDAEILVNALRKKQYPVLMVANVPGDSLFHVQVGPFADPKEAEAMRSRLAGDGYNAIVKK